jgi:hypothetical protein
MEYLGGVVSGVCGLGCRQGGYGDWGAGREGMVIGVQAGRVW